LKVQQAILHVAVALVLARRMRRLSRGNNRGLAEQKMPE
jgi:hypothetical protein